ncbi:MAG: M1 family metallopeptidase, partial [Sphingomonadales bacterium]
GQRLEIQFPEGATQVKIGYKTSPTASGLQWLSPEQTAGKTHPFLFSQSQAIHARSWVPLQDTPAVRFTYSAAIKTPPELIALMSASQDPSGERDGDYSFDMPQAIPSYLMAITVGDLEFRAISETIGVYAESYIVEEAAAEFADTPLMEAANAKLYGPYRWGRYDLLVLPPSFPFGGMENPRLSFLTPTLIAGDKSLTNVVAHELAHSWAGNQVTNSSWRDAWINEGLTSYVENRVMEDLYGKRRAVMEQVLAKEDWQRDMDEIEDPAMTALALPETLADPDEAFTNVAYVKGQFFLNFLEDRFGREVFDAFLKSYFDHFAFQSISTADFEAYMVENLIAPNPGKVTDAEIEEWLYAAGMPATTRNVVSDAFENVTEQQTSFLGGTIGAGDLPTQNWTTHEWLFFLNTLPGDMALGRFEGLDRAFGLSNSGNAEIAFAWYMKSLEGNYPAIQDPLKGFLLRVGRGKFIYRLYQRLVDNGQRDWALEVFQEARPGYHPIAQNRIAAIFEQPEE